MVTTEKMVISTTIAILGIAVLSQVVQGMAPAPPSYCCPLCPECFYTYDELYTHFITEHPAQDIEIIWE